MIKYTAKTYDAYDTWMSLLDPSERQRFDVGRRVTERMLLECHRTKACLALLDGLVPRLPSSRALRSMFIAEGSNGLKTILASLFTDAILSTARATENPQNKRESLSACVISPMLYVDEHIASLTSRDWLKLSRPFPLGDRFEQSKAEQLRRIEWFASVVPSAWGNKAFPPDDELAKARGPLRELRDRVLAHSLERENLSTSTTDTLRSAHKTTAKIADCAAQIYLTYPMRIEFAPSPDARDPADIWDLIESGARERKVLGHE